MIIKNILTVSLIFGILCISSLTFIGLNEDKEKINYNCNDPDVVFLKPSEKSLSGKIAKEIKGIAIIPEENYFVADNELLLNCNNIDFKKYLKGGDYF